MRDMPTLPVQALDGGWPSVRIHWPAANVAAQGEADMYLFPLGPSPHVGATKPWHAPRRASAALWWRHFHGYEPDARLDGPIRDG